MNAAAQVLVTAPAQATSDVVIPAPRRRFELITGDATPARRAGRAYAVLNAVVALLLIVLAAPVLLVVAIAVKLDGGPVLFRQTRVGQDGREFRMIKFRSMCVDAEARLAALMESNEAAGPLFKMARDPRITGVGAVLRKFSIDELPQLFNVVGGTMALVGPRPALAREVAHYCPMAMRRLDAKPGLTGLWQVSGRSDLSWDESIRLDAHYVDTWSPVADVKILARTAGAVLRGGGAY
ncbi:lipopolysaccharide/colanic/teichoic acid biosynthesis glycosyltransferase [Pseudonocardia sediminis]|uniref:Lipopolysaccharide/colanic/teichoic acid biosynthesis glycosyltransferase n=1 Tax=Pseudonocardia sediminis TaxID=1397368 RepID=A0A4Q7V0U4_PSEST|nr:lipopolysaccharide/colanic/teichoic acid biosynthesis glycosyltransferase [Pseudonocardia sediminis]